MKFVFIYTLNCPITGEIRYVGKAANPERRLAEHTHCFGKTHKENWIRSLAAAGLKPILEIIDEVLEEEWPMWEAAYIQYFREENFSLTNSTYGGEGRSGYQHSEETRAKISATKLGKPRKPFSPEHRAKMSTAVSAAKLGKHRKPFSSEHRAALSSTRLGKKRGKYKSRVGSVI